MTTNHLPFFASAPSARHAVRTCLIVIVCLLGCRGLASAEDVVATGSVVKVEKTGDGWQLIRNGEPYFIKGGGGIERLDVLVQMGGNSVRTWGADRAREILDDAQAHGVSVCVGFWFGHERHGFDYNDEAAVAAQLEEVKRIVRENKDHPALLMWSLGNEAEGEGDNPLIWKAINEAARAVKQIDPNHPTMTVIAEIGGNKIPNLKAYCPDIDILGVNTYGGLPSLAQRLAEAGLDRPYVITEFGPLGQWETGQTPWEVPYEQTSSEKAAFCAAGYNGTIAADKRNCLGGYVFCWGEKQEVTPTWYGLFLKEGGETTETLDVMTRFWTGDWPANRAPAIKPIRLVTGDPNAVKPGAKTLADVDAMDHDGDELSFEWVVMSESTDRRTGGDFEQTPPTHPELILANDGPKVTFKAPDEPGPYRLFVYVRDGEGHAATANLPFLVVP